MSQSIETFTQDAHQKRTARLKRFFDIFRKEMPFAIGIPAVVWQLLFFYLPICLMFITSFFTWSEVSGITFSIEHFKHIWRPSYLTSIFYSLLLSSSTAIICVSIAFPLAYYIAFRGGRFKTVFLFLLIVPFWTNFLLHIYAWFFVLEKEGFLNTVLLNLGVIKEPLRILNTYLAMMIMMVYYYLPFMTLPIYASLERFDFRLLEASYDLGASRLQTFRRILLPISLSAIRAGFFLVSIPAFGEFAIPELMGGDKDYYVGSVISQFILGEETGQLGTAYTVLSVAFLMIYVGLVCMAFSLFSRFLTRGVKS